MATYDQELDQSAFHAEAAEHHARNREEAVQEHQQICETYAYAVEQRHYMQTTVDQWNLPAIAEQVYAYRLEELENRKREWMSQYSLYDLDVSWPF
jgi:hypothetical protein